MIIIDAHAHLGFDCVFDWEITEESLIKCYEKCGISGAIVQPLLNRPYMEDTVQIHNRIWQFCIKNPGRFWGIASINPHFRHAEYKKEAERCIKDLGFVGLKLNPQGHATHPATEDGIFVFECANKLGVPVMVHTGYEGASFTDPVSLIPVIKKYNDLKIVLAHAGSDAFFAQALYLAQVFDNIYLEPSWLNVLNLTTIIKEVGANRVMFSTDDPTNAPVELAKYKTVLEDTEMLEQAFYKTALEVFSLKI